MAKIFVSYAAEDTEMATYLHDQIQTLGLV